MKKIICFGGSGFAGSHVVEALVDDGYDVTVFDSVCPQFGNPGAIYIEGNICDSEHVDEVMKDKDIVYNFAGIADIDEASRKPIDTIKVNILGNANILEACVKNGVQRFVYASSIYVFSETGSFYRCSKQACEQYIMEYQRRYDLDFTILRYGSLYGNRANEKNSVYRYLKQALLDKKIRYYGDADFVREYIHVEDAARLSVRVLSDEFINEFVILTGHHQTRVGDLFLMIKDILGHEVEVEYLSPPEHHYKITPYSFNPKLGRKVISNSYYDLGQGLLKCLQEIYENFKLDGSES
ncbi:MAG: NAD(P)-dependent oxidoreductase [Calditrichaeota bacterium]|nr:NAD(P)-dependent oxidoreductase [Calditrichota bacterium]